MKTEKVKLSQIKVNERNPRTITERKLNLLVERLLVFPKMIQIRPVVVDDKMVILGGNMRVRALNRIAKMSLDSIGMVMGKTKNYKSLSKAEQKALLASWQEWIEKPTVEIVKASDLSEAEKKEFVIADNASFGEWDYDMLANEWDSKDLSTWGVDVWQPDSVATSPTSPTSQPVAGATPSGSESLNDAENDDAEQAALPPELQGVDLTPDALPKIVGNDEVPMERIIIVYPKERASEVAALIGKDSLSKVVYSLDEIVCGKSEEE
ncbi:MAG: hypothetical protein NC324_03185 [Bacteroides sp.]|nr:hypothetical protein [Bacteroides sp.]